MQGGDDGLILLGERGAGVDKALAGRGANDVS